MGPRAATGVALARRPDARAMSNVPERRGFNVVEGIVVVAILSFFVLVLMTALPRRREVARRAACQKNLMQIGVALLLYDRAAGHLPVVPPLGSEAIAGNGPLRALLETLDLPDLVEVDASAK